MNIGRIKMIKVKFSEVKIGDEFSLEENGSSGFEKLTSKTYYHINDVEEVIIKTNNSLEVWISKFKDRYGKDLSIGDRILIPSIDLMSEEALLSEEIILEIVNSPTIYSKKALKNRYNIITKSGKNYYSIFYKDIVKIESNWGI